MNSYKEKKVRIIDAVTLAQARELNSQKWLIERLQLELQAKKELISNLQDELARLKANKG